MWFFKYLSKWWKSELIFYDPHPQAHKKNVYKIPQNITKFTKNTKSTNKFQNANKNTENREYVADIKYACFNDFNMFQWNRIQHTQKYSDMLLKYSEYSKGIPSYKGKKSVHHE